MSAVAVPPSAQRGRGREAGIAYMETVQAGILRSQFNALAAMQSAVPLPSHKWGRGVPRSGVERGNGKHSEIRSEAETRGHAHLRPPLGVISSMG